MNTNHSAQEKNLNKKEPVICFGSINFQELSSLVQTKRVILPTNFDQQTKSDNSQKEVTSTNQPTTKTPETSAAATVTSSSIPKKKFSKWSDLFDHSNPVGNGFAIHEEVPCEYNEDKTKIKEIFQTVHLSWDVHPIRPRGLNNKDNKCFLNVTLQSLIGCPPFFNLLTTLSSANIPEREFPTLWRFVRFRQEFDVLESNATTKSSPQSSNSISISKKGTNKTQQTKTTNASVTTSSAFNNQPFSPEYFYELLPKFNPISSLWHEDSQEFLCFLLDSLHSELVQVSDVPSPVPKTNGDKDEDSDEWEEVGKKNKTTVIITKEGSFKESKITEIFAGKFRSVLRIKGQKSTSSIQPFYCIHLEVNDPRIVSIEDALQLHMTNELLDDFQDPEKKIKVYASKQIRIESLPKVLILHLKRFSFSQNVVKKIHRFVSYPETLTIHPSWLVNERKYSLKERTYSLFSVVSHHGKKAAGGHYTCDIKQYNGDWLLFDDSRVSKISLNDVLSRQAYLLFYYSSPK